MRMKLHTLQPVRHIQRHVCTACILLLGIITVAAEPNAPAPGSAPTKIPSVGSAIDPSGDCRISGNAERLTISVPGSDHSLDGSHERMNAPRVLQEVKGDFTAEVTVSTTYPETAETIVPGRRPFQGAGLLLWVDERTYIRLERAHLPGHLYPSWEMWIEGKQLRLGSARDGVLSLPTTILRLSRKGNQVTGAVSDDGRSWQELDAFTVKLPEKVQIGVIAVHNTTSAFEATFERFGIGATAKISQPANIAEQLVGTWILVGTPDKIGEVPPAGGRLHFFTGRHWLITQPDADSGKVIYHHGGTYTLDGNRLVKTVDYANENTASMIHQAHAFEVRVNGDTYTQIGIDNPYSEVWKRVK